MIISTAKQDDLRKLAFVLLTFEIPKVDQEWLCSLKSLSLLDATVELRLRLIAENLGSADKQSLPHIMNFVDKE